MSSITGEVETGTVPRSRGAWLSDSLWLWTRVSIAGIGGPALQIATMHRLLVKGKRWISEDRFFHAFSYCIALPGPETQQLAVYVGWLAHRMIGGMIAGGLFILPGAICMMALSVGYVTGAESQLGQAIFGGVRPAILAIMAQAIIRFGRHVLYGRWMIAVATLAFAAAFLKIAFPIVIVAAALTGICAGWAGLHVERGTAWRIDDGTAASHRDELPDHTRPSAAQFVRSLALWLALWLTPVIALVALCGMNSIYTQIAVLFSRVALMAVGGDYAVIAYAAQQVVDSYHWLSAREMQEGVAMGEMVPGTIMIVTQFLGFMAAYRDPGQLPPLIAGAFGGLLATWVTLAPCFLWILVIAPFIEGLRSNRLLNSTLYAVTAAAVGMILNLSVWFGIRTLFHSVDAVQYGWLSFDMPVFSSFDPWALVLSVAAAVALFRFRLGAIVTLFGSSAVGVVLSLLGLMG